MIKSELIRDERGRIRYWQFSQRGNEHYNLKVYLAGSPSELDAVESVDYLLHATFKHRLRTSKDRANSFAITLWAWGMFALKATVKRKDGSTQRLSHFLSFELPDDDGTNYVAVSKTRDTSD